MNRKNLSRILTQHPNKMVRVLGNLVMRCYPAKQPQPEPEAFCHCHAELRWDTDNGGHWLHLRNDIVDHEPIPKDQPIHDEPRIVIGSIDDLTMTEDGQFTPMMNPKSCG